MSPNRNDPPARRSHRRIGAAGELNGLLRARSFIVDDAHPFCAPGQVAAELRSCLELARELQGHEFCRIHRSTIVNLRKVRGLDLHPDGDYAVIMESGVRLKLSRRFRKDLQVRLGAGG